MSEGSISVSDAISRNVNWARVIREVFSREDLKLMEVGVAMYAKPPQIDLVFYSERDMNRFEKVAGNMASSMGAFESEEECKDEDEEPTGNPAAELFTLLGSSAINKSVYKPLTSEPG